MNAKRSKTTSEREKFNHGDEISGVRGMQLSHGKQIKSWFHPPIEGNSSLVKIAQGSPFLRSQGKTTLLECAHKECAGSPFP